MRTIITSTGSTVTLQESDALIILDNPDAPDDMRNIEAGRIVEQGGRYGFQPALFTGGALSVEALRAIAALIEYWEGLQDARHRSEHGI